MPKKTYRTYRLKGLQILTRTPEGKPVEVNFRSGIQIDSTAKFTTSEEWLQEKLEKMDGFGKTFYLESVQETKAEVKKPAPAPVEKQEEKPLSDVKDIKRFHNLVEMKNAMAELGIDVTPDMNYVQAKAAAQKAGYDFQIQK